MKQRQILSELTEITSGLWYFSESEYPYAISDWEKITPAELAEKIATKYVVNPSYVKQVDVASFLKKLRVV